MICSRSSGERNRLLRPCTLMMVQNEHWYGQPRPRSMLDSEPDGAADMLARQDRRRLALQRRQVVHVVVQRRQRAGPGVAQHRVEPAVLGLAGKERDAQRLRRLHFRRHLRQHREAAGDVEAADRDRQSGGEERAAPDRPRAGNWLDCTPTSAISALPPARADVADDAVRPHAPVRFVVGVQTDRDVRPEHLRAAARPRPARSGRPACWTGLPSESTGSDSRHRRSATA